MLLEYIGLDWICCCWPIKMGLEEADSGGRSGRSEEKEYQGVHTEPAAASSIRVA